MISTADRKDIRNQIQFGVAEDDCEYCIPVVRWMDGVTKMFMFD